MELAELEGALMQEEVILCSTEEEGGCEPGLHVGKQDEERHFF